MVCPLLVVGEGSISHDERGQFGMITDSHQFRILPEHGPGAIARTARQRQSTPHRSESAARPLPEVEVRDLACYEALLGASDVQVVHP
jgi:hypothetical protein